MLVGLILAPSGRKNEAGAPIGAQSVLVESRGDWVFYKDCARFSQRNEKDGCGARCNGIVELDVAVGSDAPWRSERCGHGAVLQNSSSTNVAAYFNWLAALVCDHRAS